MTVLRPTLLLALCLVVLPDAKDVKLLNVSYDPTRELYEAINKQFVPIWKARSGDDLRVLQSHGGSGKQARSVIDGLDADIVTLALAYDIDAIAKRTHSLPENWQGRLPDHSSPFTSTVVFLVRHGNPKGIYDWPDLVKPGVVVITPNPKTSGGARWNHLAAWGWALHQPGASPATAKAYLTQLYAHVPVLETGARGATTSFAIRNLGDVLITWESEAIQARAKMGPEKFDIVRPTVSILAEPPVAVVDRNAARKGNQALAKAYLDYLYTPAAQEIAARNGYRPRDTAIAAKHLQTLPAMQLFTLESIAGNWKKAQQDHFGENGIFDQIYRKR